MTDVLAIVEAAYRLELPDGEWLSGVASACRPFLDQGFGLYAFEFRFENGKPRILQSESVAVPPALVEMYPLVFSRMGSDVRRRPFDRGPCVTGSEMMGLGRDFARNPLMQEHVQKLGMYDSVWITAAEPSGWGVGLHSGRPRISRTSRGMLERWSRIAAHLSAAARLRRRLPRENPAVPAVAPAEAVFSADGRVVHAEGAAKDSDTIEQLRHSVLNLDKARRSQRADAQVSLALWRGLVDQRWSLLDAFEDGGVRYVVARENAPQPNPIAALTLRERQVLGYAALGHDNKVIAYDLGISHSTVKVLMARAASKLGVRSRADVISAYLAAGVDA